MVDLNKLFLIAYNTLFSNILTYSAVAIVNGILFSMSASYDSGVLTLKGSILVQASSNSLTMQVYLGQYLVDSINTQAQISPGTYDVVYVLTIDDNTGIINNAIGLTATGQLSSASVSTNASGYAITLAEDMLTFYLAYSSYPSTISITVTFTLTNSTTVEGSYSDTLPSLPQGTQVYYIVLPVTFD